ncbi:hypothetical protein [Frankia sp. AgB32]|uniref:hypothetical protein n=1 Tax=Frankia sp. AgB32 TaxID=631119 RepID=UPI00200CD3AB|nr:hypothetical protein [Frankia sp. AgB32]MCK9893669.1 hypothetical protein [Frankia sp. AgB32]
MSVDRGALLRQRRVLFAVDLAGFGTLPGHRHDEAQAAFERVVRGALDEALRDPGDAHVEGNKGDSFLVVLPAAIPEARTVAGLVRAMRNAVATHNRRGGFPAPMRVRLAFGQGTIESVSESGGLAGDAVIAVMRLLNSAAVKKALAAAPARGIVLALTTDLYRSVVVPADSELLPADFTAVSVHERAAEEPFPAYLWTDGAADDTRDDDQPEGDPPGGGSGDGPAPAAAPGGLAGDPPGAGRVRAGGLVPDDDIGRWFDNPELDP